MIDEMALPEFAFLVLATIGLHIFVDFHLQGCLADLKQKKWWLDNVFDKGFNHKYDKDYLAALMIHGLEWSIAVHIPIFAVMGRIQYFTSSGVMLAMASVFIQAILHAIIDDLKCNRMKINLITDQMMHFIQIILIILLGSYVNYLF